MRTFILSALAVTMVLSGWSQTPAALSSLPVNLVPSTSDYSKSLVLYITGDGGWNSFSQGFTKELASKGYPVVSLNANKYFWKKKTPAQAAADVALLINEYAKMWNRSKISIVAYSFGADVAPFIFNRLSVDVSNKIRTVTLMSPSSTTDFEIHLMGMVGGKSNGNSVPAEINRMGTIPVLIVAGDDEKDFPFDQVSNKKATKKIITGGHHYDGNVSAVCAMIIQHGL